MVICKFFKPCLLGIYCLVALLPIAHASDFLREKEVAQSFNRQFSLSIYPKEGEVLISQYHDWIIHIEDFNGNVVADANIVMSGGMVAHGHGLPSKPQISRYLGKGNYLIDGVLFNMAGEWTLQFVIQTPTLKDRARIDLEVEF